MKLSGSDFVCYKLPLKMFCVQCLNTQVEYCTIKRLGAHRLGWNLAPPPPFFVDIGKSLILKF